MADKYNCKWVERLGGRHVIFGSGWAITLGQTTYYSVSKEVVDKDQEWQVHEQKHKDQWRTEGRLRFAVKYLYWLVTLGYMENPYELEAEQSVRDWMRANAKRTP